MGIGIEFKQYFLLLFLGSLISNTAAAACNTPVSFENFIYMNADDCSAHLPGGAYREVQEYFDQHGKNIFAHQLDSFLGINKEFHLGKYNHSGINWVKPFGGYQVGISRTVTPHLTSNRYLIRDTFLFEVRAQTLLSYLKDQGQITISDTSFKAFAGIAFYRKFEHYHFGDDYESSYFEKPQRLLNLYQFFNLEDLYQLEDGELLTSEDYFSYEAGANGHLPIGQFLTLSGGVIAKAEKTRKLSAERKEGSSAPNLIFEQSKITSKSVEIGLMLDLYQLIRISLFRYELTYSLKKSTAFALNLKEQNNYTSEEEDAFDQLMQLKSSKPAEVLMPYVTTYSQKESETMERRRQILFYLSERKKTTSEQIIFKQNTAPIHVFSHQSSLKTFEKNPWRQLIDSVIGAFVPPLIAPFVTANVKAKGIYTQKIKELTIDYSGEKNTQFNEHQIENSNDMSLEFTYQYDLFRNKKKYQNRANDLAKRWTGLPHEFINQVKVKNIYHRMRLSPEGVFNLIQLPNSEKKKLYKTICNGSKVGIGGIFRRISYHLCKRELKKKNNHFMKSYHHLDNKIKLFELQKVLESINAHTEHYAIYHRIFGAQHLFSFGHINSVHPGAGLVTTYFKRGDNPVQSLSEKILKEVSLSPQ